MKWVTTHHIRLLWFTLVLTMNGYLWLHEFLKGK